MSALDPRVRSRGPVAHAVVSDERGVMLVEVLVSAVVLIMLALSSMAVIDRAGEVSAANRARSVATALAQKDQDFVRQMPWSKISQIVTDTTPADTPYPALAGDDGSGIETTIDGMVYRVATKVSIKVDENTRTACLAGWRNKRVFIETTVTPPAGVKMKPVEMHTERVPLVSDKSDKGSIIVRLTRANGNPTSGVTVAAAGTSKPTDDDGCAVFNDVTPATSMTVTWGTSGGSFVDENGADEVSRLVTITAGVTAQLSGRFDDAKSPTVHLTDGTDDGDWSSVSVVNSGISTVYNGVRSFTGSGSSRSIGPLFPFMSPYGVFAGSCWGNDPTVWGGTASNSNTMALNGPFGTIDVLMPKVTFTVPSTGGYRAFIAYDRRPYKMGAGRCSELGLGIFPPGAAANTQAPIAFKTTDPTKTTISYPLPYGIYRICVDNPGLNKRTATNGNYRIDNVPAGSPKFTNGNSLTLTAGQINENGTCANTIGAGWSNGNWNP